jgi:hypothetical protein
MFSAGAVFAYRKDDSGRKSAPDLDVRNTGPASPSAQAARGPGWQPQPRSEAQAQALQGLRDEIDDLTVRWSDRTGSPSRIYSVTRALTGPRTGLPEQAARSTLIDNLALFDLQPGDISELHTKRNFRSSHNGVSHITFQQKVQGIPVFGGEVKMNLDADGRLLNISGEPRHGIHAKVNTHSSKLSHEEAASAAAASAGVGRVRESLSQGLVFFPITDSEARLAWRVVVEDADSPDIYDSVVDAVDGRVLWRKNLTHYTHIDAHGLVYTGDSPDPNTPVGTSTGIVARQDVPFPPSTRRSATTSRRRKTARATTPAASAPPGSPMKTFRSRSI